MKNKKTDQDSKIKAKTKISTRNQISDTFKKIITAGSPTDISKELFQAALGQVHKTKDDISAKVTSEMITLIRKIDFVKEFSKFAEDHKFKISAEVEILKKKKD